MSDIFISHVEENSNLAVDIAAGLQESGYSSWYYERDSLPGPSYLLQTSREIEESRAVILIISPDSLSSRQVTKEVVRAYESGKPFVPVLKSISHVDFASRQPEWKEAVGSAASISIPRKGASVIVPQIVERLQELGIEPSGVEASASASAVDYRGHVSEPKKPLFRIGSLKIAPVTAIVAALVIASLITGALAWASMGSKDQESAGESSKPAQDQLVLRPRASGAENDASAQTVADSGEAPVSTREVKTSAGTLVIDGVKASDRFMECPMSGRCTQRAGGKFILGITFRSAEGKSAASLQQALSQEALSSHVKTSKGTRVEAFNFDLTSGKTSITVIYAYMDAGMTSGLVLYWEGNPPIAIQSGSSASSSGSSTSETGGSGSRDSSSDDGSFVDEPVPSEEEFVNEEPPPEAEPSPEEPPPEEEPPPDDEPFPEEEPPPEE